MIKKNHKRLPGKRPDPCPTCPTYKTCKEPCQRVENWINEHTAGANFRKVMLYEDYNRQNYIGVMHGRKRVRMGQRIKKMNAHFGADSGTAAPNRFEDFLTLKNGTVAEHETETVDYSILEKMRDSGFPSEDLKIVEMVWVDGLTPAEAARRLGICNEGVSQKFRSLSIHLYKFIKRRAFWKEFIRTNGHKWAPEVYSMFYYHFCKFQSAASAARLVGIHVSRASKWVKRVKDDYGYKDYDISECNWFPISDRHIKPPRRQKVVQRRAPNKGVHCSRRHVRSYKEAMDGHA